MSRAVDTVIGPPADPSIARPSIAAIIGDATRRINDPFGLAVVPPWSRHPGRPVAARVC